MTFHANGFRSLSSPLGVPAANSEPGNVRQWHTFITNDDRAAVETSNYFDPLLVPTGKIRKGDILTVVFDVDATVGGRHYVLNITGGHVVITPFYDAVT